MVRHDKEFNRLWLTDLDLSFRKRVTAISRKGASQLGKLAHSVSSRCTSTSPGPFSQVGAKGSLQSERPYSRKAVHFTVGFINVLCRFNLL